MTAFITRDPLSVSQHIAGLTYQLLVEGLSEESFHANENAQAIRDRMYALINGPISELGSTYTMYIDKRYANPAVQQPEKNTTIFGKAVARWLEYRLQPEDSPIVLAFDSVLTRKQQEAFKAEVKPVLKSLGRGFNLTFQPVKEEACGQVADYVAWAWSRQYERGDRRALEQFTRLPQSEFNLFRNGRKRYY